MNKVYLLLGLTLLLALAAFAAYAYGPQFELRGLPDDIREFNLNTTDIRGKWRMIGGLVGFVALLFALLSGIVWFNVRKRSE
jgi:FtsH-binding integral membrane protein